METQRRHNGPPLQVSLYGIEALENVQRLSKKRGQDNTGRSPVDNRKLSRKGGVTESVRKRENYLLRISRRWEKGRGYVLQKIEHDYPSGRIIKKVIKAKFHSSSPNLITLKKI